MPGYALGMKLMASVAAAALSGAGLLSRALVPADEAALPAPPQGVFSLGAGRAAELGALPAENGLQSPAMRSMDTTTGEAAPYADLSDLIGKVGHEADLNRTELAVPALRSIGERALAELEGVKRAQVPLKCLSNDIKLDVQAIRGIWSPAPFGLEDALVKAGRELDGPGEEGLLARLDKAAANLESGHCLITLADKRLGESEQLKEAVACHRRVASGLATIRLVHSELVGFWPVVEQEWTKTAALLAPIAASKTHPDRIRAAQLMAYAAKRILWHKLHPDQAREALALADAAGEERFEKLAAGARLRRDELGKTLDAFADAWRNQEPTAEAGRRARDAWLALDGSAQSFARGGNMRRDAEAEGSRLIVHAFLDLMDSRRSLLGVDSSLTARRLP